MIKAKKSLLANIDNYLTNKRFASVNTKSAVNNDLNKLLDCMLNLNICSWQDISYQDIHKILLSFRKQNIKPTTTKRWISSCKHFFNWLELKQNLTSNPFILVKLPKTPNTLPPTLSVDEVFNLLELDEKNIFDIRDIAMFEVLYSAALRVSEMVNLNITDFELPQKANYSNASILVTGKRNKQRKAVLGKKALAAVKHWLGCRDQWLKNKNEQALFINKFGKRLSPRSVQYRIAKRGLSAGLSNRIHPHKLRHASATHLLESSNDLRMVQEMLGHVSISSTQIYTRVNFNHLAKVYDKNHPRAKLKKS